MKQRATPKGAKPTVTARLEALEREATTMRELRIAALSLHASQARLFRFRDTQPPRGMLWWKRDAAVVESAAKEVRERHAAYELVLRRAVYPPIEVPRGNATFAPESLVPTNGTASSPFTSWVQHITYEVMAPMVTKVFDAAGVVAEAQRGAPKPKRAAKRVRKTR